MSSDKRAWVLKTLLPVVVIVSATMVGSAALRAQARDSPLDLILAKVNRIIEIVQPPPGPVRLSTPAVWADRYDAVRCSIANVGTSYVAGVSRLVGSDGGVIELQVWNVLPGKTHSLYVEIGNLGLVRCEFEFQGTAAMARANVNVFNPTYGGGVAADAR